MPRLAQKRWRTAGGLYVLGHPENVFGLSGQVFGPAQTALLYVVYDPLAPNWTVKERALKADMFHLSLRAKSFRVGGDGEAYQILKRRAAYLQRSGGYASYRILDYSEGVESSTPLTHRVGEGTILLVRAETASEALSLNSGQKNPSSNSGRIQTVAGAACPDN